jgi:transposase
MRKRRGLGDRISYVGFDVHKNGIAVAALRQLAGKLGPEGVELRFCYESGPCGHGIQRQLSENGHECIVVAPSLIPKRTGDRVKTDRRDAASLVKAAPGRRVDTRVGSRSSA